VLSLTGIDRLLDIYPSVSAALAGPRRSPSPDHPAPGGTAETDGGVAVTLLLYRFIHPRTPAAAAGARR
jgi:hypothetical protein